MAGNQNSGQTPQAKSGLSLARLAFLYGSGNGGKPLRDREKLVAIAQVHPDTLRRHILIWEDEEETMAQTIANNPLTVELRPEIVEAYLGDREFLRREVDKTRQEIESIDRITANLEDLLERIAESVQFTRDDVDGVTNLLDKYLQKSVNRQKLVPMFQSLQKHWMELSGVADVQAAWAAGLRERTKAREKKAETPVNPAGPDLPAANPSRFNA